MPEFRREHHRLIAAILKSCDADFLSDAGCYFGGGTQIAMQLVEYRESRDIDFLCGDQAGVRKIRETVTQQSLGKILRKKIPLAREVRADRYGVRTFFAAHDTTIKFEIVFEARIALSGAMSREFGVPVLDLKHAVAEKLLANTDRGLDESTRSRDLIDLAFLVAHHGRDPLRVGWDLAHAAYGGAVGKYLAMALKKFTGDRRYASACIESLAIDDTKTLRKGLAILRSSVSSRQASGA